MADKAWNTVFIAEQASFQPSTLSWVRPRLVEADASLHEAQVLLLTPQRGYALWKRQIDDAWENTSTLYQSLREKQTAVQGAQNTFTKTLTALTFLIPCLEAKTDPELQQDWLDAAKARRRSLCCSIRLRSVRWSRTGRHANHQLSSEADKLEAKCKSLLSRFEPAALQKRVVDCQSDTVAPDPKRIIEIEALLATPFPSPSDRRDLRDAERSLEARLKHSTETNVASSDINKTDPPRIRVKNRFDRIIEFLKLSGSEGRAQKLKGLQGYIQSAGDLPVMNDAKGSWSKSDVEKVWRAMADIAQYAYRSFTDRLQNDKLIGNIDPAGLLALRTRSGLRSRMRTAPMTTHAVLCESETR